MTDTLRYQLTRLGAPTTVQRDNIDSVRHPYVAVWVEETYENRFTAGNIMWGNGYRRFGDVFEAAARKSSDPATALEDPWMLVGLSADDLTYPTKKLVHKLHEGDAGSSELSLFIQTFNKLGNVPNDFHDLMKWAGGRYIAPKYRWDTWVNGVLGRYASTWTVEDLRALVTAGVKRRDLDTVLGELYGVKAVETRSIHTQVIGDVPYAPVASVLLDGVAIDFARELL